MNDLFKSYGTLKYGVDKLIVNVDPEIVRYYRFLISKKIYLNRPKYSAHISVVRKEIPPNKSLWNKYSDKLVEFFYTHQIRNGSTYFWLDVFSIELEEIRSELGLMLHSKYVIPPNPHKHTFHVTIGNIK